MYMNRRSLSPPREGLRRLKGKHEKKEPFSSSRMSGAALAETAPRREDMETPDYLVFASAGGVEAYFAAGGTVAEKTVCVCIGPVTARALAQHCEKPFLTAEEISVEGVVQTILAHRALGGAPADGVAAHEQ